MGDDLTAFLLARLEADEAYALNAFGDHNDAGPDWDEQWSGSVNIGDAADLIATNDSQVSRFIVRNDPSRVLREVAAKRTILAEHEHRTEHEGNPEWGFGCDTCHFDREFGFAPGINWCQTLRALAAVWSDHPDYDATWRPTTAAPAQESPRPT